jgi:hypothetical protein
MGRALMVLGVLAIPGTWTWCLAGPCSAGGGWSTFAAILVTLLAAGVYVAWLIGFVINRAAFRQPPPSNRA